MELTRPHTRENMRITSAVWLGSALLLTSFARADVSGLDAGELGGAAWSLGVAHPSGFPLDMLLLRSFGMLPLGPLAFRQNLGVSLVASTAVSCIAYLCLRLCRQCGCNSAPALVAGALVCAAALLGSQTFVDAALSVEVYATALLCVAIAAALFDAPRPASRRSAWPLIGLALGAHVTAPWLLAPIVLAAWVRAGRAGLRSLGPQLACCGMGALVLSYVPLAALRDSAFDWGDPEVFTRWLQHISAARIREAYADALFARAAAPRLRLFGQLTEHAYWLAPAALGGLVCWRKQRGRCLLLGALFSFDLAYAAWINPMGIEQRQVGHASAAVLALFAGCGCAQAVAWLARRGPRYSVWLAAMASLAGAVPAIRDIAATPASDGYAVSERYGAASPLADLPARAVYACHSDSGCASALFAIYAEGARPDMDVVPAQHLWDPTVLRRLRGMPLREAKDAARWPASAQRAQWALRRTAELLSQTPQRPVFVEDASIAGAAGLGLRYAPFLAVEAAPHLPSRRAPLAALEHARFGDAGPQTTLARALWANAHVVVGAVYLRSGQSQAAVDEFAQAVTLTPQKASTLSNLGVALEQRGDLAQALERTAQAVQLDPSRPTPWVNLTRLLLQLQGPRAARAALLNASRYDVHDPRLETLDRELSAAGRNAE